jgi:acyl dehydratase
MSLTMVTIEIDDLPNHVGAELGRSGERLITQKQVDLFAEATEDHQWIHVDPERARGGPFGHTIAHGYLSLSLVPSLLFECLQVTGARLTVNYGANRVRFPAPVPVGERVHLAARINEVKPVQGGHQLLIGFELAVVGADKPSAVGEVLYNFYA